MAMLTTNMQERANGRISLKNNNVKTGQDLLFYLYNHQLRKDADFMGLLEIAEQYDMQELKAWCANLLAASVTKDNSTELLHVAELYDIELLKRAVLGNLYIPDQVKDHGIK
jgi:BTB/POZ domain